MHALNSGKIRYSSTGGCGDIHTCSTCKCMRLIAEKYGIPQQGVACIVIVITIGNHKYSNPIREIILTILRVQLSPNWTRMCVIAY